MTRQEEWNRVLGLGERDCVGVSTCPPMGDFRIYLLEQGLGPLSCNALGFIKDPRRQCYPRYEGSRYINKEETGQDTDTSKYRIISPSVILLGVHRPEALTISLAEGS